MKKAKRERIQNRKLWQNQEPKQSKKIIAVIIFFTLIVAVSCCIIYQQFEKKGSIIKYVRGNTVFLTMIEDKYTNLTATGVSYDPRAKVEDCLWVTAAHMFGPTIKEHGYLQRKSMYLTNLKYQGNDIATFSWGSQPEEINSITNWVGRQIFQAETRMLFFDQPEKAMYLPNQKEYKLIGQAEFYNPSGEKAEGCIIEKKSTLGDCGKGFLVYNSLCIITKSMEKIDYQGKEIPATFCVLVDLK